MTMDSLLSSKNSNVKKRGWNDTNSNDPLQYMHQQPIFQPVGGLLANHLTSLFVSPKCIRHIGDRRCRSKSCKKGANTRSATARKS